MNIALVILNADPRRGGAERYTFDLASDLVQRGHAVWLLARTNGDELPHGVGRVVLDRGGATRLGQYLRFLDALDRNLDGESYDVVHAMLPVRRCDVYHPHAGIAAEALRSGHRKHRGRLMRGLARAANRINRKRRGFVQVERQLLSGAEPPAVICLSDYIKTEVRRHYALPEDKLVRILNGVDLVRFDPARRSGDRASLRRRHGIAADSVVGLMIAQDFARKGLAEAIEALALIAEPRLALLVVGRDDPRPYRRLARHRGVGGRVIFAGPTTDPAAYYAAADFFVLPTRHDPCSLVVLEALAMGLPVISTAFNGACEAMRDGVHGFVMVDPADLGALAEAMRRMLDDPRRQAMAQQCRSLREELSQAHHVQRIVELYERLRCHGGRARQR